MYLTPMKEILALAEERKIAYGAFVVTSYDNARAACLAANEVGVPLIFICGTDCIELVGGFENMVATVKAACVDTMLPVALHLDHAKRYEDCASAINAGFSSVMLDGSALPFEENARLTKRVVDLAHPLGISVEGELGQLIGEEGSIKVDDPEVTQTDPDEAKEFVRRTGVDCLAVSIGTQHGVYTAAPRLNIERLKKIHGKVTVPLVLHGGSGTPVDQVQASIHNGVRKVNVATDVLTTYVKSFEEQKKASGFKYNTAMFAKANADVKAFIMDKMKQFALL